MAQQCRPAVRQCEAAPRDPARLNQARLHAGRPRRSAKSVAHRHGHVHAGFAVRLGCRDGHHHGKRDVALAKRLIAESGYKGEKVVIMVPEIPKSRAMAEITRALFQELGLNVGLPGDGWGTLSARARNTDPAVRAGWSCYCVGWAGLWPAVPGSNIPLAGVKPNPRMEELRTAWFDAPDCGAEEACGGDAACGHRGSAIPAARAVFHPVRLPIRFDRFRAARPSPRCGMCASLS